MRRPPCPALARAPPTPDSTVITVPSEAAVSVRPTGQCPVLLVGPCPGPPREPCSKSLAAGGPGTALGASVRKKCTSVKKFIFFAPLHCAGRSIPGLPPTLRHFAVSPSHFRPRPRRSLDLVEEKRSVPPTPQSLSPGNRCVRCPHPFAPVSCATRCLRVFRRTIRGHLRPRG